MSNLNQFFDNKKFDNIEMFPSSGTFTAKRTGLHRICVLSAGGSGAASMHVGNSRALGGAGGGFAYLEATLTKGATYEVIVGAGGATAYAGSGYDSAVAGNSGGYSMFGTLVTATGGKGGVAITNSSASFATVVTGGSAVGGDVNYNGASPGTITCEINGWFATGGGSAGSYKGNGYRSGNITTGVTAGRVATGGGGVGGTGWDFSSGTDVAGQAGGSFGAAPSNSAGGPGLFATAEWSGSTPNLSNGMVQSVGSGTLLGYSNNPLLDLFGAAPSGRGAGGTAVISGTATDAGQFGGGGASAAPTTASCYGGAGGRGGGGGGASGRTYAGYVAASGAGGNGFVTVEY